VALVTKHALQGFTDDRFVIDDQNLGGIGHIHLYSDAMQYPQPVFSHRPRPYQLCCADQPLRVSVQHFRTGLQSPCPRAKQSFYYNKNSYVNQDLIKGRFGRCGKKIPSDCLLQRGKPPAPVLLKTPALPIRAAAVKENNMSEPGALS
jgi:hypothetical protein